MAYMPGVGTSGALVWPRGGFTYLEKFDLATSAFSQMAGTTFAVPYPQFFVPHHTSGKVVFGGSNDIYATAAQQKMFYVLSANGTSLTRLDDCPVSCNMAESSSQTNRALMCAHPTQDAMLVFHSTGGVYQLNFNAASGSQWVRHGDLPAIASPLNAALSYTLVAAIPAHGVIGIVQWRVSGQSKFWVYRPAETGTATVSWTAPTTNTDGSAIPSSGDNAIAEYRVSWYKDGYFVNSARYASSPAAIYGLSPGTYSFYVTTIANDGEESDPYLVGTKVVS
jgi:hypothetical protein